MKSLVLICILNVLLGLWHQPLAYGQQSVHPLEQRRDELLEKRYYKTLLALREKDNKKTIAMLQSVRKEFVSGMEKLKPEYEHWVNSLTVEEIEQLMERLNSKKYFDFLVELQTDQNVISRYVNNQEIFNEYRKLETACDRAITF